MCVIVQLVSVCADSMKALLNKCIKLYSRYLQQTFLIAQ